MNNNEHLLSRLRTKLEYIYIMMTETQNFPLKRT